ncbi:helix-turn-helix transcriptional regulator [Methylobacterium sp. BTF04]|uniref:helix-turn-helix transcriptional regulator n=1 Tax=Methylobacterium sp. BTF04 TaxID=2708300 RepID=UPI0013D340BF|nr:helix-turn-helix transcriptional regulator [Methylobacterium sp. BTF04]NEU12763.1 helix-turn-helix transcriptional regulator [Methylobacterium sp. BTF04]
MAGLHHDSFSKLAPSLERSVLDPSHWPVFLENVARATGSEGSVLIRIDEVAEATISTPSVTELTDRYFSEDWHTIDHRLAAIPLMRDRGISVDQDFTTREEFERLPYYQDFLGPHGLRWFAGVGFQSERAFWCLSLQRTPREGFFEPHEQARLLELVPALRRTALLTSAVERARAAGMTDAFDLVGRAAMILDGDGRAVRWNESFAGLLDADLRIAKGRLVTRDASTNARIESLSNERGRYGVTAFAVRRRDQPPIVIHVLPLGGETRRAFAYGTTLLVACTPEIGPMPAASVLQTAYGLTKAEARLAVALAEGESMAEASQRFAVAYSTTRTQVQSIFAKTGVSRQVDLVRLVFGLSLNQQISQSPKRD